MKLTTMKLTSLIVFTFVWVTSIAQESVALPNIPTLAPGNSLTISEINYSANQNRDILVEIRNPNNKWLGMKRIPVNSGSGKINATIKLNNNAVAGNGYTANALLVPKGKNWQHKINNSKKKFNVGTTNNETACNKSAKITELKASASETSVSVSFNNLSNVTTYEVRTFNRGSFNGTLNGAIKYTAGKSSPINITGLQAGKNYTFAIRALCEAGVGATALASVDASTTGDGNNNGDGNVGTPQNNDTGCQNTNTVDQGVTIWPNPNSWTDSYNANGFCFCKSTFDHGTGNFNININGTPRNIKDVCNELTKHPKYRKLINGDKKYNSLQCGHAPRHSDAITIQGKRIKDEQVCPGRVDQGSKGCKCIGPKFDMKWLASRPRFKTSAKSLDKWLDSRSGLNNTNGLDIVSNKNFNTFPIPATIGRDAFLKIDVKESELATIAIYNLNGNLITSITSNVVEGTTANINITELINSVSTAGAYAIVYKAGNIRKSDTIIIK